MTDDSGPRRGPLPDAAAPGRPSEPQAPVALIGWELPSGSRRALKPGRRSSAAVAGLCVVLVGVPDVRGPLLAVALGLAALTLLALAALRLGVVLTGAVTGRERRPGAGGTESATASYTVLVPLYREGNVVDRLVRHLSGLEQPPHLLQILLLCEKDDAETLDAVGALDLAAPFELVVCPPGEPRTKARACNVGLRRATGELTVIYDAEDRPDLDQLGRAASTFAAAPPHVACLQGRLDYHNHRHNWLTRCFTLEYAALFGLALPGQSRWGLPLPLGGTSNHFRTSVLRELGGWDPYNVTEDAELGVRLHRAGYRTRMLTSVTLEEACAWPAAWFRQRTRWMKGYLQTWLAHAGGPASASRGDHGDLAFRLALHGLVGGAVVAAALVPALWAALVALHTPWWPVPQWRAELTTLTAAALLLSVLGQLVGGWLAPVRADRRLLAATVPMLPLYGLLVSFAAYRAGWQLVRRPYLWEKTPHGLSGLDTDPVGP